MLVQWVKLGSAKAEADLKELESIAHEFWNAQMGSTSACPHALLQNISPDLEVQEQKRDASSEFVIKLIRISARPRAELLMRLAPTKLEVSVGTAASTHDEALKYSETHTGILLNTARVRVGFTRGHLLEVVIQVPLGVAGTVNDMQIAAELYLEKRLGDKLLDEWVCDVSIDRIARTAGLMMLADNQGCQAEPLSQVELLVSLGRAGVRKELPLSLLGQSPPQAEWTALSIPPSTEGPQKSRLFASTLFPEALKAALEGLPFHSGRFTQGSEIFINMHWGTKNLTPQERIDLRDSIERHVSQPHHSEMFRLAGTGFDEKNDYIDLWILPESTVIYELAQAIADRVGPLTLEFYDSIWGEESHVFWSTR